ncbi:MAG: 4Fe-4S binding protein [Prevotellaceae bacterium]|jgi:NAD-dependent dihydropyrimidine dehydrogenase PreA subunit|nr:4Fe-4S binding protein [Prevotellaceae bacterium]
MKRTIIKIDKELCNGCGKCVTGCHEGALQLVDGKAVIVNEQYCDGLGACIGDCPLGAITLEEREAAPFSEEAVMKRSSTPQDQASELRQFPLQLRLLHPQAGFLQGADLLLAADCTAFVSGEFHSRFLKGKMLAIACPKLDGQSQLYVDKLAGMIDAAQLHTLTVLIMEVPCCNGLVWIAEKARQQAQRDIPVKIIRLSTKGEIVSENLI